MPKGAQQKKQLRVLSIGASARDSDWLKFLDGGVYQKKDLAAHDAALEIYEKERAAREKAQRPGHLDDGGIADGKRGQRGGG